MGEMGKPKVRAKLYDIRVEFVCSEPLRQGIERILASERISLGEWLRALAREEIKRERK